jgi:hypothetical protein
MRSCLLLGLIFSMVTADPPTTLLKDYFLDGNYTVAEGASGMTWTVLSGGAAVSGGQLAVNRPGFIVCDQQISTNEFTIQFDATATWSGPRRFVFLYKDSSNYYWMGLGNTTGVYRVMAGFQEQLYADSGSKLRLPHASPSTNSFKIYVHNTGTAIDLKFDRGGDGVDYDVELTDTNSIAAALFKDTGIGASDSETNAVSGLKLDNILIRSYLVVDSQTGTSYYVDAATGDDSRTAAQAVNPATPWKTIQKGVDSAYSTDTVLVMPGVYRETVSAVRSGKASAPITIKAFNPADKPVLDGSEIVNSGDWQATTVTNLNGVTYTAYKTPITWNPGACYQDGVKMFASQEPNQSNPDDSYDLSAFRSVPPEFNTGTSLTTLKDPSFFTQPDSNYWVGASLLLYDGAGNYIVERKIIQYIPEENTVIVQPFANYIGPNSGAADKYAIRYHPGCLDQPGEFYVDTNQTPYMLYVMPYEGRSLSLVSASRKNYALNLNAYRSGIVIDGFDIRFYTGSSVSIQGGCEDVIVRNCDIHQNMAGGVDVRSCNRIAIESSRIYANYDNAVSFGPGSNYLVDGCEITANGNNGVWAGSGSSVSYFVTDGMTVRNCYIHHQGGRRSHADNYQMQQVRNVLLENNVFIQSGEQNMWCQYSDEFILRNNIFMGGPLGLGAVMHNYLYNNVFYNSSLRYDSHLTDSPFGNYYLQQEVKIRNNSIIESGIAWPPESLVNRRAVFSADHNYYNIESSYTRSIWDFGGYRLGVNQGGSILIASPQIPATNQIVTEFDASITWSAWGRFICLYKDSDNYYSFGLGADAGIFRKLNGVETKVYTDTGSLIRIPHSSGAWNHYKVQVQNTGAAIGIKIARDQTNDTWDAQYSDTNAATVGAFNAFQMGIMTSDTNYDVPKTFIDSVILTSAGQTFADGFEDGNYTSAAGTNGIAWTALNGGGAVSYVSGVGVGFGAGSIVHTSNAMLSQVFITPPDALYTNYNFHLTASSPLRDAGADVGIATDKEGRNRIIGSAPDIGPYEYDLSLATSGDKLPMTVAANPDSGIFTLRGVQSKIVSIATVSGTPVGTVQVSDGSAQVDVRALAMKSGLYRIAAGSRTLKVILL